MYESVSRYVTSDLFTAWFTYSIRAAMTYWSEQRNKDHQIRSHCQSVRQSLSQTTELAGTCIDVTLSSDDGDSIIKMTEQIIVFPMLNHSGYVEPHKS
jgi:hypothetical protein